VAVAVVDIRVDSSAAVNNLRRLDQASKNSQNALDALARKAAGLGAALVGGFAIDRVIRDVTELDRNIRRLGTVGVDVAKISPALSRLSSELGGVANKADLAAASYQAASAGFSDTAGNIEILRAATKAATGGLADTAAVTEVLVKTLNAYGMSGSQAFKVTDSISKAVELGNQEWSDYTSLLGRVASISALAGVNIDELNAFIASATKNGATAEVAFTGLGAVLNTLLQPTKESQEAAAKLGIAWNYGGLQAKGFTGLMAELAKAMEKDKETTARLLGSQEAMRGAFAANAKGGADFRMVLEQLNSAAGKTDSDFNTMKNSLENTLKALDTSFKNLSEALGRAFGPTVVLVIQDITKGVNSFADVMNTVPQPVLNATGEIIKMIAQVVLLRKAIEGIIALRAGFIGAMAAMGATTATTGAAATTSASAFALYTRNTQTLAAAAAGATPKLAALRGVLGSIAAMGVITVAVNIIVNGLQETFAANAELAKLRGRRAAGGAAATFAGATKETVAGAQAQARKTQAAIRKERAALNAPGAIALQQLNIGGALSPFGVQTITGASQRRQVLNAREREAQAILGLSTAGRASAFVGDVPSGGGGGGGLGGAGGGSKEAAKKTKEIKDITAQELELRLRLGIAQRTQNEQQEAYYNKQLAILQASQQEMGPNERKAAIFEAVVQYAERLRTIEDQRNKETLPEYITKLTTAASGYASVLEYSKQLTEQQKQQQALADGISNTVGQGMTSAFNALIQGSQDFGSSLRQIASGVLIDIANQLLQVFVIQKAINAISGLFGGGRGGFASGASFNPGAFGMASIVPGLSGVGNFFGGARANGGSVMGGKGYLVGERGPELFMPGRSGGIAPTGSFGGGVNVVVNVDASGSQVQGDQTQAKALGGAISAAVQAEIVKQQRPGGLLAGTR
jgi:TP901 family phage tail tape measure protein